MTQADPVKPLSAGNIRAPALIAAAALAVGLVLGFSLGRFYAPSAGPGTDALERRGPGASIGRASPPSPSSPETALPSGSSGAEGSPGADEARAGSESGVVRALAERLAQLSPGPGANPTREIIEVGPLLLMLEEGELPHALTLLENLRASPSVKAMLLSTLFMRWTELNPAAALERAEAMADPQLRSTASQAVLSAWAEEDPQAAWNYVMSNDAGAAQLQLFIAIAMRDPGGAAALTRQIEDPATRKRANLSLASFWASQDPWAALAWANSLDDAAARRQILPNVLAAMAQQDPPAALDLALAEADASVRQLAVFRIFARAVSSDPDAGLVLLDRLPEDFPLEDMTSILGGALLAADAEKISGYLGKLPQGKARANFLNTIVQSKINRGASAEALPFLDLLPEGAGRADVYHTFARGWGQDDPRGTSEWLEQIPPGRVRDRAVQGFSWSLLESDPEAAFVWAASIDEPKRRDSQLRNLALLWLRRDPDAAVAWIGSSDLFSSSVQEQLMRGSGK
jgi:hypothetical protein